MISSILILIYRVVLHACGTWNKKVEDRLEELPWESLEVYESVFNVARIVSIVAQVCLLVCTIASLRYARVAKLLTVFVTIDMVCHCTLRVSGSEEED